MKHHALSIVRSLTVFALLGLIVACGGSDTQVTENPLPPPVNQAPQNYSGPPPATADVLNFKLALWDNISSGERCGACHIQGEQGPTFARFDDINLAYTDINGLVNLTSPQDSALVTKVGGGHNCWLTSDAACADILTTWISNWGADEAQVSQIQLQKPVSREPGANKNFPAENTLFANTVYPVLAQYCADCHTSTANIPISPYIASEDVDEAYQASKARLNLDTPADSRVVGRIRDEFHNCWSDCPSDAATLVSAIQNMADGIELTELSADLVNSQALTLFDGTLASGGGRFDANVIAKWEFKTGSGNTAFDTSGVEPALDLTLSGQFNWVGGWGIQLQNGKAQGSTSDSKKIRDLIVATGEFSIEAWVAPANVTQEGPARIVSYSGGRDRRNMTLGQTLYNYDALLRTTNTDINGQPALSTADADEDLQAALQHVVVNYDAQNGRQIFVNGEFTGDADEIEPASLSDWDDSFAMVLGNEVSGDVPWAGTIRMVAIHNRVMSPQQIQQNFDVGIGQKFFLLFGVSQLTSVPDAYIVMEVSQFDSYSYLFSEPFFISLTEQASFLDIQLAGMRIGVNGRESAFGQAFANLDTVISSEAYQAGSGQTLSRLGTIVPVEKGAEQDEFFLTFEQLGDHQYVRVDAAVPTPPEAVDTEPQSQIGVRNFAEINASMANLTRVPSGNPQIRETYDMLLQQLPVVTGLDSFVASNQMAITQLAIKYCDQLVETSELRNEYFPDFDFNQRADNAFDQAGRTQIITPLMNTMLGEESLLTQPQRTDVESELNQLIGSLSQCSSGNQCDVAYTSTIVKASCAALLGSAVVLIQ